MRIVRFKLQMKNYIFNRDFREVLDPFCLSKKWFGEAHNICLVKESDNENLLDP